MLIVLPRGIHWEYLGCSCVGDRFFMLLAQLLSLSASGEPHHANPMPQLFNSGGTRK
ncbi:hypothetical protein [Phormidium sp. CCY1219]|uniref:hypothetical protein n=1 Tax=Phormidium sp. CCY1219 TaxID=2886104 RepID=UPI002D1F35C9|nr:hypothetical protein [Phormidium sp. CCY1219]MEB3831782.1 hypothetical protein [Phormidium sp. CCY1219]